jgi:hypothetical protein
MTLADYIVRYVCKFHLHEFILSSGDKLHFCSVNFV